MLKSPMIVTLSYLLSICSEDLIDRLKKFQYLSFMEACKNCPGNVVLLFKLIMSSKGLQIRPFLTYSINPHHYCFYPVVFEFHIDL